MIKIKELSKKILFNKEMLLYMGFGTFTTIINFVVYILIVLYYGADFYKQATVISWFVAVTYAFFANKFLVFGSRCTHPTIFLKELFEYLLVRILSGLFDYFFMIFAVDHLIINHTIAKVIAITIVMIINYFLSKMFIFNNKEEIKQS